MLSLDLRHVVNSLVTHMMHEPGRDRATQALHIQFWLSMTYYPDRTRDHGPIAKEHIDGVSKTLHLLYHRRPGSTYISAFSFHEPGKRNTLLHSVPWIHEGTHDSGWRDIMVFSKLYFTMAEEVNRQLVDVGHPPVAPLMMSEHNSLVASRLEVFRWVNVEVQVDPHDEFGHRRIIKVQP